jgi:hypothetical protein
MKRLVLTALLPAFATLTLASTTIPAGASAPAATATYTIGYTCTAGPGCTLGVTSTHTYTLAVDCDGVITGTGTQVGYPQIVESVTGTLSFDEATRTIAVNFVSLYVGPLFTGYTVTVAGTVDPKTGVLTGTATSQLAGSPELSASSSVLGTRDSITLNGSACSDWQRGPDAIHGDDDGD